RLQRPRQPAERAQLGGVEDALVKASDPGEQELAVTNEHACLLEVLRVEADRPPRRDRDRGVPDGASDVGATVPLEGRGTERVVAQEALARAERAAEQAQLSVRQVSAEEELTGVALSHRTRPVDDRRRERRRVGERCDDVFERERAVARDAP